MKFLKGGIVPNNTKDFKPIVDNSFVLTKKQQTELDELIKKNTLSGDCLEVRLAFIDLKNAILEEIKKYIKTV